MTASVPNRTRPSAPAATTGSPATPSGVLSMNPISSGSLHVSPPSSVRQNSCGSSETFGNAPCATTNMRSRSSGSTAMCGSERSWSEGPPSTITDGPCSAGSCVVAGWVVGGSVAGWVVDRWVVGGSITVGWGVEVWVATGCVVGDAGSPLSLHAPASPTRTTRRRGGAAVFDTKPAVRHCSFRFVGVEVESPARPLASACRWASRVVKPDGG